MAFGGDLDLQNILVAVGENADGGKCFAGGFAFFPQDLAGAAVEVHLAGDQGYIQGFAVHVGEHEHAAIARIGDNGRDQACLIKLQVKRLRFIEGAGHQREKPPDGERTSSMKRACMAGLDLNSPVNCVVMVATLRLPMPRMDMQV